MESFKNEIIESFIKTPGCEETEIHNLLSVNYTTHPPTTAWRNVMNIAQAELPSKSFPTSKDVEMLNYCPITGNIANANCPDQKPGYYKKSTIESNFVVVCQAH